MSITASVTEDLLSLLSYAASLPLVNNKIMPPGDIGATYVCVTHVRVLN